jgi:TrmH family RNA methyltransferase
LTAARLARHVAAMADSRKLDTPLADRFTVVLVGTQDLVNIAGTVRAMANMGLARLRLVQPAEFDTVRIAGIAHGTEPLIERIEFYDSLWDAVTDASHVVGTTARRRTASYVWQNPREAAPELLAMPATAELPVALVFGREDAGLTNDELDLCDRLLVAPTNPHHSSLNLAQAVLLVGYELWMAAAGASPLPEPRRKTVPATPRDFQLLFEDARATLDAIEFFKSRNEEAILRTFRAIVRRAPVNHREAKLLRAILIEVRKYIDRRLGEAEAGGSSEKRVPASTDAETRRADPGQP